MFVGEKNYVGAIPPRRALQFPETGYGSTGSTIYHFPNISFSLHSNPVIYDLSYRNIAMLLFHCTDRIP
jgi:hypothetical protein